MLTPPSERRVREYEDMFETAERVVRQIVEQEEKHLHYVERDALIRANNAIGEARKELARARTGPVDEGTC
jgi:predicted SAM-dependent methyltransferase